MKSLKATKNLVSFKKKVVLVKVLICHNMVLQGES